MQPKKLAQKPYSVIYMYYKCITFMYILSVEIREESPKFQLRELLLLEKYSVFIRS